METAIIVGLVAGAVSLTITTLGLVFNPLAARRQQQEKARIDAELAEVKLGYDRQLADLKARLDDGVAERKAQRDYEYDARKKLYAQIEPMLLQLGFAAENCFSRVANIALVSGKGYLDPGPGSWLVPDDDGRRYYLDSTVYFLLLPLGFFEIVRLKATQLDLKLEPRLDALFRVMRQQYRTWAAEFAMSAAEPSLDYTPYAPDAPARDAAEPQRFRRQGVALGRVDKIAAAMVVAEGAGTRVRRLGEFQADWAAKKDPLFDAAQAFYDLFRDFRPDRMPVLWRLLCAQACLAYAVRRLIQQADARDAIAIVQAFCRDPRAHARLALTPDAAGAAAAAATLRAVESVLVKALAERDLLET